VIGHDERYNLCEGSVTTLPDGELVCYLRENSGMGWPGFKAFSRDEGRTWEGVYPTPMEGCHRPVSGLLPSGRVLVTYRYRQGGSAGARLHNEPSTWRGIDVSYWARNTFAYLETAESAQARDLKAQGGIILPIDHDRSPRSDSGYTGWVTLHDGRIFCVNYIVDDAPMAQIRGYWFGEGDF
jgi:sialidase-1